MALRFQAVVSPGDRPPNFVGIVTEDLTPFDPSADEVMERSRRTHACFPRREVLDHGR